MELFKTIAFTHKTTELKDIGRLHIEDDALEARLSHLKSELKLEELLYVSTCNRVEFLMVSDQDLDETFSRAPPRPRGSGAPWAREARGPWSSGCCPRWR